MFSIFKKKVPVSNEMKEVDAIVTWSISWRIHTRGRFASDMEYQKIYFLAEQDAIAFKESLLAATTLLKYCVDIEATIDRNDH